MGKIEDRPASRPTWHRRAVLAAFAGTAATFSVRSLAAGPTPEPILEPDLPIVDPHHHLWVHDAAYINQAPNDPFMPVVRKTPRYLVEELLVDLNSGHNIVATVYVQSGSMYRAGGPEAFKPVGEVEYANGIAAMGASGVFGKTKMCAGIVGRVDLQQGTTTGEVLKAMIHAGDGRLRGIRPRTSYSPDPAEFGGNDDKMAHVMADRKFREGFGHLYKLGLSADIFVFEPQLPDLIDLARAFPQTQIILDHTGTPVGLGRYTGTREERFPIWRENMRTLSKCSNVAVKLGGLGMPFGGFSTFNANPPATSLQLAADWKPYVETCIEAFGVNRCMFESDYPADAATCSYAVLWNAFKRLTSGASNDEKTALYSGTAAKIYRLEI